MTTAAPTPTWKSRIVGADDLPPGLEWFPEEPNPDYTVKMAFAVEGGLTFRRITFSSGAETYFQIERSNK